MLVSFSLSIFLSQLKPFLRIFQYLNLNDLLGSNKAIATKYKYSTMTEYMSLYHSSGTRRPAIPSLSSLAIYPMDSVGYLRRLTLLATIITLFVSEARGIDIFLEWNVSSDSNIRPVYMDQPVITINGMFPGPLINTTTNDFVHVNIFNNLDEPFLMTWNGIQQRLNSWQDGVSGTNCPIQPGTNWTYVFQIKDQIGSFFYFPTINFHKAAGGFGPIRVNNRNVILVPFPKPEAEFDLLIGDWYSYSFKDVRDLTDGRILSNGAAVPDFILMNGKPPYNNPLGPTYESFNVTKGKTYRLRISNRRIGILLSLCSWVYFLCRWNMTAGAARPNPQGTFNVTNVTISQTFVLHASTAEINGQKRYAVNNVSYLTPDTPLKLADQFLNGTGVYQLDAFPTNSINSDAAYGTSVVTGNHKGWIEIVFKNDLNVMDAWHLDGFGFYVVGFGDGDWSPDSRTSYNLFDPVVRSTVQVYPGGWSAVYAFLDNPGMWNLRSQRLPNWYMGQELYIRVFDPDPNPAKERAPPSNILYCGIIHPLTPIVIPLVPAAAPEVGR
ncbi:hypothetical protein IFM89_019433 [Coptis chinensis]|uniref:Monocopper oxidase-like protein SKU5 n=1 Tax=Coptis chinensis TaxID=261450 RepID=A0A835LN44_9MAGN|nr:hypothetical protein IFM89_019433 [Coptis chinensis]